MGWQQRIKDHDSLDNNEVDKNLNEEGGGMGSSSPLVMLLRRMVEDCCKQVLTMAAVGVR